MWKKWLTKFYKRLLVQVEVYGECTYNFVRKLHNVIDLNWSASDWLNAISGSKFKFCTWQSVRMPNIQRNNIISHLSDTLDQ